MLLIFHCEACLLESDFYIAVRVSFGEKIKEDKTKIRKKYDTESINGQIYCNISTVDYHITTQNVVFELINHN